MDIGTDKVMPAERRGVPHFGLDRVAPDEPYSAGQWAREARGWIDEIEGRGHLPLLVGGTGFFLRALRQPMFREPELDEARRAELRGWLDAQPVECLASWVRRLDPERAPMAEQGGRQRLSRTLEVALLTGRALSVWHRESPPDAAPVPVEVVVLEVERAELDRRIDARVSKMVARGFVDEVQSLLDEGYGPNAPGMSGTGYREVAEVLMAGRDLDDALDDMRRQTRQYARRQLTWFRNQLPDALRVDATLPFDERVRVIADHWRRVRESEVA
jgi:tRNA dimethylallyltransferase